MRPTSIAPISCLALIALAGCVPTTTVITPQPAPTVISPAPAPAPVAPTLIEPAPAPVPPAPTGPVVGSIEEPAAGFDALSEPDLQLVRGFRDANDPCQLAAETRTTRRWINESSDLVACLTGGGAGKSLVAERGAQPVAQTLSYTLYQVPRS